MKVLLFTHKNDIDGMGNAVLANLAFENVEYVLCGTFDLTESVLRYYENERIYNYDKIFVTDLCLDEPILSKIAKDEKINEKIFNLDHHRTFDNEKYTKHHFINIKINDEKGLCCGTSLFYEYLVQQNLIDENNLAIKEFVELTRQHDTWEWRNIYNNEKARELSVLFDALGPTGYINFMTKKLSNKENKIFKFDEIERMLIDNRIIQINEKIDIYCKKIVYKNILGLKAGIIFITYEYRNELAEYFRQNNFDIDFAMMIAPDPGVVCYRTIKEGVNVREVAEYFCGKGHDKAATNAITEEMQEKLLKILTEKNNL